jgi:hypothetical protein
MAEADAGTAGALAPGVAAALHRLESLDGLPASAHVAAFEQVQRSLDEALADIDGQPASDAPPARPQPPRPQPGQPAQSVLPAQSGQSVQPSRSPQPARQPRPHPPRPGAPGPASR